MPHSDSPLLLAEARQWMQRWLKDDSTPVAGEEKPALPKEKPEDLACLAAPPTDAINDRIHDQFISLAAREPAPSRAPIGRSAALKCSRSCARKFRLVSQGTVPFETKVSGNSGGWSARYADFKEVTFATEPGVRIRAQPTRPRNQTDPRRCSSM